MRWMRMGVVAAFACKVTLLAAWWVTNAPRSGIAEARTDAAPAGAAVPQDLLERSRGFRELLEAVRARGAELDRREHEIASREAALKTLEQALGEGGGAHAAPPEPATVPQQPTAAPAAAPTAASPAAGGTCAVAVTKIYQTMKPEEAAPILDRLDDATARAIFGCMKEKQIGALLAAMNKERAVALTRLLAGTPEPPPAP